MAANRISRDALDLLSSMRFAVSLLTVLAVASVIGTVLKQAEPYPNYIAQFGPYWFPVFEALGLYDVYHAGWFLTILVFLVTSTSLCVYRNGPSMLREMRSYRERVTEASLRRMTHHAEHGLNAPDEGLAQRLSDYLGGQGFRLRTVTLAGTGGGVLIAAKAGSYHRMGYILTHCGIVVICAGGLLDGNLPLKFMQATGRIVVETRDIPQSKVPPESRLSAANLSFRGNVTVPEGTSADVVFLNVGEGYLVQELPFTIALKKFHIEHYSTGQPKDFASDIELFDKLTGETLASTIRVNHPLIHRGVAIYQASFADGGTRMQLTGWPLFATTAKPFPVAGAVNQSTKLSNSDAEYRVEFTDFRPFNIENMAEGGGNSGNAPASPPRRMSGGLGSAAGDPSTKNFRNVGPSFQYKLRDAQGQAVEFSNYMLPLEFEGRWYLLSGTRSTPNESFRFLRLPLDDEGRIESYFSLRAALLDRSLRTVIAKRFARAATNGPDVSETMRERLAESAERVLDLFSDRGFEAIAAFLEKAVPKGEQEKVADVYLRVLEGTAFEALNLARAQRKLAPLSYGEGPARFVRDSLNSISDSFHYGAPIYLQLNAFEEVKASGLQITRSPGKNIVYFGSLLLVLGVFAMFYIRERRIWLLVKPEALLFAMAGNRQSLDFDREFSRHRDAVGEAVRQANERKGL